MYNLIFFCLSVIGMTGIVVDSKLFEKPRAFAKKILPPFWASLFDCHQCAGTWCGFLLGVLFFSPRYIVPAGFVGSFLAMATAIVFNYLEARSVMEK